MYDVKNKESYYSLCYLEVLLTCSGKLSLRVSLSTCQHEVSLGFYVTTREIPQADVFAIVREPSECKFSNCKPCT